MGDTIGSRINYPMALTEEERKRKELEAQQTNQQAQPQEQEGPSMWDIAKAKMTMLEPGQADMYLANQRKRFAALRRPQ